MRVDQFYESRRADWEALTRLLDRSQADFYSLSPKDIKELGHLYRVLTSDLALAQRDFPGHRVTLYLNQLMGRARAIVYRGEPMAGSRLLRFITTGFPRVYRQALPFTLIATLLFILP